MAWLRSGDLPSLNFKYLLKVDDAVFVNIDWTLNPNALVAALPTAGAVAGWSAAKAGALLSAYRSVAGDVAGWSAASLDRLGGLVAAVNVTDIARLSVAAWRDGAALAKMSGRQLGALAARLGELSDAAFARFLAVADPQALREAVGNVASAAAAVQARAAALLARLTSPDVLGPLQVRPRAPSPDPLSPVTRHPNPPSNPSYP